mgnify:CR=1 FL=1
MPTVDVDRDTAHDAAQHELARPIYPKPSLFDRIAQWLDDQLFRLTQLASDIPGGWFTVTVLAIVVAVAVVVAVRMARRAMRVQRSDQRLFDVAERTAAAHRAAAEQHAARGEWAAAIRERLRAVARQLEEDDTLTPVPGRTAGELAHDAGAVFPDLSSQFDRAATAFNDVAYGEIPGTSDAYRMVADLDDRLREHSVRRRPATTTEAATQDWTPVR